MTKRKFLVESIFSINMGRGGYSPKNCVKQAYLQLAELENKGYEFDPDIRKIGDGGMEPEGQTEDVGHG